MSDRSVTRPQRNIVDLMQEMRSQGDAFAVATVVKTVSVTAAKPGAKAIIDASGEIVDGWIGGGCAKRAVQKAAVASIADGQSRLVSLMPDELMDEEMPDAIDNPQHIKAANMCPSKGSMEIFIEPMLANPVLLVFGSNPVAKALANLGAFFDIDVELCSFDASISTEAVSYRLVDDPQSIPQNHSQRYVIVATQGAGDMKGLELALSMQSRHVAFVGSSKKISYLKNKLIDQGFCEDQLQAIQSPAGIDINAVTPQEIALSILADVVSRRRAKIQE